MAAWTVTAAAATATTGWLLTQLVQHPSVGRVLACIAGMILAAAMWSVDVRHRRQYRRSVLLRAWIGAEAPPAPDQPGDTAGSSPADSHDHQPPTKGVRRRLARRHRNRPIHLRGGIPMTDPALYRPTVFTATAIGGLTSHEGGDYLVQSDRCARFK